MHRHRRNRISFLPPSLLAAVLLAAVQPLAVSAQITPEQVAQLQAVTSTSMSPDGRWVAYTLSQPRGMEEDTVAGLRGFSELWIAPTAAGEARAVVRRPQSASGPRGRRTAVCWVSCIAARSTRCRRRRRAPGHHQHAHGRHVVPVVAGRAVHRVHVARGGVPEAAERRRRGDDVMSTTDAYLPWVFPLQAPRPVRLWVQPVDGGEARAITPAAQFVRDFTWAPDSRRLAVQITDEGDADADQLYRRIYTGNGGWRPRNAGHPDGGQARRHVVVAGRHAAGLDLGASG
jgi:dipeptidyl aminopeptidase/acylaminoacyl peptidase